MIQMKILLFIPEKKIFTITFEWRDKETSSYLLRRETPSFWTHLPLKHTPPSYEGKTPSFLASSPNYHFPIEKSAFYWIFQWKCIALDKVSTKYNGEMCLHDKMSYKLLKGGNMSPC